MSSECDKYIINQLEKWFIEDIFNKWSGGFDSIDKTDIDNWCGYFKANKRYLVRYYCKGTKLIDLEPLLEAIECSCGCKIDFVYCKANCQKKDSYDDSRFSATFGIDELEDL